MTLRQLIYLIAVAEEHSFTRAAQRVGVEQSPLSRAILRLERNIGFLLLERTRPSCKLTPAGEIFVQHALAIVDLAEHNANLLSVLIVGATDHQLKCTVGGATAIVFQPPGKATQYTLTIGAFHRIGLLEELDTRDIDVAIKRIEDLQVAVIQKIVTAAKA